jgi:hypothetical protein
MTVFQVNNRFSLAEFYVIHLDNQVEQHTEGTQKRAL